MNLVNAPLLTKGTRDPQITSFSLFLLGQGLMDISNTSDDTCSWNDCLKYDDNISLISG